MNDHLMNLRVQNKICKVFEESLGTLEGYIGGGFVRLWARYNRRGVPDSSFRRL